MHRAHRGFILEGSKFSTKQFSIIETGAERRTTTWNPKIAFSWRCLQVFYQIGKCSGRSTPTSLCKTDFISGTFNSHPGSFRSISKWRRKWKIGEQIIRLERVEIVCLFRYRYLRKLQNWPIFQMPLSWRLDISAHHTCKQAQIMDVVNIPCYLIFLSTLLFNAPRYPSLLNSLHSFDALSACDDFKALLFLFLCYINIYYIICTPADMNFMICWEISS